MRVLSDFAAARPGRRRIDPFPILGKLVGDVPSLESTHSVNQLRTGLQRWRSRGERIALSIPTEMLAVRCGRRGQRLGARGAPIHAGL